MKRNLLRAVEALAFCALLALCVWFASGALERKAIAEISAESGLIIATGGGAVRRKRRWSGPGS